LRDKAAYQADPVPDQPGPGAQPRKAHRRGSRRLRGEAPQQAIPCPTSRAWGAAPESSPQGLPATAGRSTATSDPVTNQPGLGRSPGKLTAGGSPRLRGEAPHSL